MGHPLHALSQSPLAGGSGDFTITAFVKPGGALMGTNPATWSGRRGILGYASSANGFADAPSLVMVGNGLEYSVNQPIGDGSADPKFVRRTALIENVFTEHRWSTQGETDTGVQGAHLNPLGLFLTPLGLFLRTSILFV